MASISTPVDVCGTDASTTGYTTGQVALVGVAASLAGAAGVAYSPKPYLLFICNSFATIVGEIEKVLNSMDTRIKWAVNALNKQFPPCEEPDATVQKIRTRFVVDLKAETPEQMEEAVEGLKAMLSGIQEKYGQKVDENGVTITNSYQIRVELWELAQQCSKADRRIVTSSSRIQQKVTQERTRRKEEEKRKTAGASSSPNADARCTISVMVSTSADEPNMVIPHESLDVNSRESPEASDIHSIDP